MMGSPNLEEGRGVDEGPRHRVTIGYAFAVGVYEITFTEWDACLAGGGCGGYRPDDEGGRGRQPVIRVSWEDAREYVAWLSRRTAQQYRLLTEAEWEYVARAGTATARYWGEREVGQCGYANGRDGTFRAATSGTGGVDCRDGYHYTAPVGTLSPNAFGLHDVLGNVQEWVEDCWHDGYGGTPTDGRAWMAGGDCSARVLRGGSWFAAPGNLRSANRARLPADIRYSINGFRVARTID